VVIDRPGRARLHADEGVFKITRGGLRGAMNGDRARCVLVNGRGRGGRGGERMAVVRSVEERSVTSFVGTYELADPLGVVRPLDARIDHDFFVPPQDSTAQKLGVQTGDVVVARILSYPMRRSAAIVTLERKVGSGKGLDLAMETVIASHGLRTEFPEAALDEAAAARARARAGAAPAHGREDLTGLCAITIDPTDARDFDDAVSVRELGDGGYELGVHIADVAHYVAEGSSLDLEARARTCSVYLADRVIPMLPERLSNDLCSLRPDCDRLCMTVFVTLDAAGEVTGSRACASVIRSKARLDYGTADALLAGELAETDLPSAPELAPEVARTVRTLDAIAALRRAVRERRGALDFDTKEVRAVLDEGGVATGVEVRSRSRATSLIEEAMLLANESVASMLAGAHCPCAYRVHDRPSADDLAATIPALRELGLLGEGEVRGVMAGDAHVLRGILDRVAGTPVFAGAQSLLLRAQQRAVYLPSNNGHYALAAACYCHFTSPIRRYPDLVVHRSLKALLDGRRVDPEVAESLSQVCQACSEGERTAEAASRESQEVKIAELYATKVGERFSATVVGCVRRGVFVMVDGDFVEGFVPARELGDERFDFDARRLVLVGEESGTVWGLGRRLTVVVRGTDPAQGQIDFSLA